MLCIHALWLPAGTLGLRLDDCKPQGQGLLVPVPAPHCASFHPQKHLVLFSRRPAPIRDGELGGAGMAEPCKADLGSERVSHSASLPHVLGLFPCCPRPTLSLTLPRGPPPETVGAASPPGRGQWRSSQRAALTGWLFQSLRFSLVDLLGFPALRQCGGRSAPWTRKLSNLSTACSLRYPAMLKPHCPRHYFKKKTANDFSFLITE